MDVVWRGCRGLDGMEWMDPELFPPERMERNLRLGDGGIGGLVDWIGREGYFVRYFVEEEVSLRCCLSALSLIARARHSTSSSSHLNIKERILNERAILPDLYVVNVKAVEPFPASRISIIVSNTAERIPILPNYDHHKRCHIA